MRKLSIAIVAMSLSACAANGLPYPEHPASALVPDGVAKVTIFRANDTLLYSARTARLVIDGEREGRLATGGFRTFTVPPGSHVFTVKMWDTPGTCELTADIQPDDVQVILAVFGDKRIEVRYLLPARQTVRRPKIEYHRLAV